MEALLFSNHPILILSSRIPTGENCKKKDVITKYGEKNLYHFFFIFVYPHVLFALLWRVDLFNFFQLF